MSEYTLFLDESGDHNLRSYKASGDLFLLCGCIIQSSDIKEIDRRLNDFKLQYFGTKDVVLHYRDIRKRLGVFSFLCDSDKNKVFLEDLRSILLDTNFRLLLSVIDKRCFIQTYGRMADDPYLISFNFIIERYIYSCTADMQNSYIIAEKRGNKEDEKLIQRWVSIYQKGTSYVDSREIQSKIKEFSMKRKSENINGLQIADIAASSCLRHFIHPNKSEDFFDILKHKINRSAVKVFPTQSPYLKTITPLL